MKMANSSSSSGMGFFGLLTVLFVALKLTGYIGWSWFWVLFPLVIVLFILLFIILAALR